MGVKNTGGAPDRFVISGSTTVKLTSGADQAVTVTYYTDTNANGVLDAGEVALPTVAGGQDTGLIAPGATLKLVAVIPVPCASAQGTYTINQKAVSPTSGTLTDNNDTVKVGGNGTPPDVTKTVDKTKAQPGDVLTYIISGTNKANANITKAVLKDTVPANTTYVSFAATYHVHRQGALQHQRHDLERGGPGRSPGGRHHRLRGRGHQQRRHHHHRRRAQARREHQRDLQGPGQVTFPTRRASQSCDEARRFLPASCRRAVPPTSETQFSIFHLATRFSPRFSFPGPTKPPLHHG